MYGRSAVYYDAIYSFKNYESESEKLHKIIQRHKKSGGNTLLDVACGTGNHIAHLRKHYTVEGLDINRTFLEIAREKNPGTIFHRGNMASFRLDKRYDVITCLFSAIGFVKTRVRLVRAIANMARHVIPGGLILVEPWFSPQQWNLGHISANFVDEPNLKLARMSISRRKGNLSVNDEHFLVASRKGVEGFVERLELGLFTPEDYIVAFKKARLEVTHHTEGLIGRGLYIGFKP